MPSIAQRSLGDLEHEMANTRRVLERYPAGKDDFTPHKKSWTLTRLATHLSSIPHYGTVTIETSELDFARGGPPEPELQTSAVGLLAMFDSEWAKFRTALNSTTDAALLEIWTMKNGDNVILSMPRIAVMRGLIVSHMVHHRAQLTLYYRMLDIPVPALYGPSADEN